MIWTCSLETFPPLSMESHHTWLRLTEVSGPCTELDFGLILRPGYAQTQHQGFEYNGESNLDLQYGMGLVGPSQTVTLYQVGDTVEG